MAVVVCMCIMNVVGKWSSCSDIWLVTRQVYGFEAVTDRQTCEHDDATS
jgi:hypothetical protein